MNSVFLLANNLCVIEVPKRYMDGEDYLDTMQAHSKGNWSILKSAERCGCFNCHHTFDVSSVTERFNDYKNEPKPKDDSALCPVCGTDTLVPEIEDFYITSNLMHIMGLRYMTNLKPQLVNVFYASNYSSWAEYLNR